MADNEGVNIDGRPISSLRVVDLRKECEKRGLSKTGSKLQLSDRLRTHLQKLEHPSDSDYSSDAGAKVEDEGGIQNEFVKQYLERQKLLLASQTGESERPSEPFVDTSQSDPKTIKTDLYVQQQISENKSEKTVPNKESSFPVREQTVESSVEKFVPEVNQETPEHTVSEEESDTESDMGRSKRKTARVDENKGENKDKEPTRRSRRKMEKEEDVEIDTENVKKTEKEDQPLKSIDNSGDNIFEKMDISISKTEENSKPDSAAKESKVSDFKREDAANGGENTSNNADSWGRERKESSSKDAEPAGRRKSNPKDDDFPERERRMSSSKDTEPVGRRGSNPNDESSVRERRGSNRRDSDLKITESSRKNSDPSDEKTAERKGRSAERRGSNPTEKMDCEVTSSQDNKAEKKQNALNRPGDEKHRRRSSSSRSRSGSSSRSRSRSSSPKQRPKVKKSRASSSDSSRSRSPARTKSAVIAHRQLQRSRSRSSSSSRSRSRSPTPKRVKMKKRSDSESSRSRSRSSSRQSRPEVRDVRGQRSSSRSRSKSSSRSRSPDAEKMQTGDNIPSDHKEKSFYTEEEESPLPVKVKSRATIEIEKTAVEPVKADVSKEKEDGGIPQESEKTVAPVIQIRKISLNRGKSNDLSKTAEGEGEKMEEGEAKVANGEKPAKKRKWGSKSATSLQNKPKKASSLPISTDSLKGLIPDIKPSLKLAEPLAEEMDYEDDEELPAATEAQEDTRDVKIQRTVVQEVKDNPDSPTSSDDETGEKEEKDEKKDEESGEKQEVKKTDIEKTESQTETITKTITVTKKEKKDPKIVRQISNKSAVPLIKPDEPEAARRSPSPARNPTSKIVHVRNLVRPFTLGQLKELLRRTGPIVEEEFWIDKIKSHCFATYESEEDAVKTRQSLHNTRWPHSNPKTLVVDYGTEEQVEFHKQKEMPVPVFPKKDKATLRKEKEDKKEEERLAREKEIEQRRKEREKRIKEREEREKRNKPKPVREWDREKLEKGDWDRTKVKSRSRSPHVRQRSGSDSPVRERRRSKERKEKKEKKEEEAPAKLLDDLFRKTKVTPCIYWLPLTEAQIEEKEKARLNRVEERLKRLAATELTNEDSPVKQKRRLSSPQAKEEKGRTNRGSPARRQRSSDERPRRGLSDERGRQRAEGRRDSRSRSGKRR